jgi:acetylornithine/N-succinyldiaminopimelate aminotransferase
VVAKGVAATTFKPGNHGTTFGGNPLAMRAGLVTMQIMQDEGLLQNAHDMGAYIKAGFESALGHISGFKEVRGRGLMMGVTLDRPCSEIVPMALEAGLVLNVTADSVIRLLPPLIYKKEHADLLLGTLIPLIKTVLAKDVSIPTAKAA